MAIRRRYYYREYYYIKKRKRQKIIVCIISATILLGIGYSSLRQVFKPKIIQPNNVVKQQQAADQNVANLYVQSQELKSTMQKENATVVLSGTKQVSYTFSNQQGELNSKGNPVGFLKKTLDSLTVKKITYGTEYSYMSVYDNKNIETRVEGDKLYITIFERALSIKGISENKEKTVIKTDIGILNKNFTPWETNSISKYVSIECYNSLINSESIRKESIENTRQNVIDMCRKLNIKNFQINVSHNNVMEYTSDKLVIS